MTERHPFHLLLPQEAPVLRRRALKLTGNAHRADDLVQDTLLKAWASRDSYCPDTRLRAWLFTILRNTFYSDLRKRRREVEDANGVLAQEVIQEPSQEHKLALNELMCAMAVLAPDQRKALILMGAYGYSQLEAAEASGCSVGTIKSRVSRSRSVLNQMLAYDGVMPGAEPPAASANWRPGRPLRDPLIGINGTVPAANAANPH